MFRFWLKRTQRGFTEGGGVTTRVNLASPVLIGCSETRDNLKIVIRHYPSPCDLIMTHATTTASWVTHTRIAGPIGEIVGTVARKAITNPYVGNQK